MPEAADKRASSRRAAAAGMGHGALRIVAARRTHIAEPRRQAIGRLAEKIRADEPRIADTTVFGALVNQGCGRHPTILFGSSGEIPLLARTRTSRFDYRIGWLARRGDVVVIGGDRNRDFETYQQSILGTDAVTYLGVPAPGTRPDQPSTVTCLHADACFRRLRAAVDTRGGATLMAHLTTGTVWALAARLAAETGKPVDVAGPAPLLSRRANDKLWFGAVCSQLLGAGSVPEKRAAHCAAALARHVADLARKHDRLVLKIPDSAGAAGNMILNSATLRGLSLRALCACLRDLLESRWQGGLYPLAVEVWDANVLSTPSVQCWIPPADDAEPVIEGVFEQALEHGQGAFIGAIQAELPRETDRELVAQAAQFALLFQRLGYFGRCSFDALLLGKRLADAKIHWVECNARWGGVSLPMSLVNRLREPDDHPGYVIVQLARADAARRSFATVMEKLAGLEFDPGTRSGVVVLSPDIFERGAGVHFLSVGRDRAAAIGQAGKAMRRLF